MTPNFGVSLSLFTSNQQTLSLTLSQSTGTAGCGADDLRLSTARLLLLSSQHRSRLVPPVSHGLTRTGSFHASNALKTPMRPGLGRHDRMPAWLSRFSRFSWSIGGHLHREVLQFMWE